MFYNEKLEDDSSARNSLLRSCRMQKSSRHLRGDGFRLHRLHLRLLSLLGRCNGLLLNRGGLLVEGGGRGEGAGEQGLKGLHRLQSRSVERAGLLLGTLGFVGRFLGVLLRLGRLLDGRHRRLQLVLRDRALPLALVESHGQRLHGLRHRLRLLRHDLPSSPPGARREPRSASPRSAPSSSSSPPRSTELSPWRSSRATVSVSTVCAIVFVFSAMVDR